MCPSVHFQIACFCSTWHRTVSLIHRNFFPAYLNWFYYVMNLMYKNKSKKSCSNLFTTGISAVACYIFLILKNLAPRYQWKLTKINIFKTYIHKKYVCTHNVLMRNEKYQTQFCLSFPKWKANQNINFRRYPSILIWCQNWYISQERFPP